MGGRIRQLSPQSLGQDRARVRLNSIDVEATKVAGFMSAGE